MKAKSRKAKWGYIDKTGAWIKEPKFDVVWAFEDGVALVKCK